MRHLKLSEVLLAILLVVSIAFNLRSYILEQTRHEAKEISALQSVSAAQAGSKFSRLLELPVASPSPDSTEGSEDDEEAESDVLLQLEASIPTPSESAKQTARPKVISAEIIPPIPVPQQVVAGGSVGHFAELFTDAADASPYTLRKCISYGGWSDICVYRRLCFKSSTELAFIVKDIPTVRGNLIPRALRGSSMRMSTKMPMDDVTDLSNDRLTPLFYRGAQITYLTPDMLHLGQPKWHANRTVFVTSLSESLENIWYFSSRVLPLFTIKQRGHEWGLPSLEHADVLLFGNAAKTRHDWHQSMVNLSVTSTTRVLQRTDAPYYGLGLSDQLSCVDTAVLTGAQAYGFSDWFSAYQFRKLAYNTAGLEVKDPPYTVTILDRSRDKSRHFVNIDEVQAFISTLGVSVKRVILGHDDTFKEQVRLMSNTGVLVTMHGAGLMNEVFLPPGAAVIEVFPPHVKHVLYEQMAHNSGIHHFKVYATEFTKDFHERHPTYKSRKCDDVNSLDIPSHPQCWELSKNAHVVVPLPEFKVALVHALDFIQRTRMPDNSVDAAGDSELIRSDSAAAVNASPTSKLTKSTGLKLSPSPAPLVFVRQPMVARKGSPRK